MTAKVGAVPSSCACPRCCSPPEIVRRRPGPTGSLPPRRRILVVDDNRDAANSLAELLTIMGNETKTAYDGLEALAVAAVFRPDVTLLDPPAT